jgi:hypothetical protein
MKTLEASGIADCLHGTWRVGEHFSVLEHGEMDRRFLRQGNSLRKIDQGTSFFTQEIDMPNLRPLGIIFEAYGKLWNGMTNHL